MRSLPVAQQGFDDSAHGDDSAFFADEPGQFDRGDGVVRVIEWRQQY